MLPALGGPAVKEDKTGADARMGMPVDRGIQIDSKSIVGMEGPLCELSPKE